MWVVPMVMNAMASTFWDNDEPYDAETWMRNVTTDAFGKSASEVMAHGPLRLLGLDFASRLGVSDLFWRSPNRDLEGSHAYGHNLTPALGPTVWLYWKTVLCLKAGR